MWGYAKATISFVSVVVLLRVSHKGVLVDEECFTTLSRNVRKPVLNTTTSLS